MAAAFVFASRIARRILPEVDLALKAAGVIPNIKSQRNR
jgi:hypothetical protein